MSVGTLAILVWLLLAPGSALAQEEVRIEVDAGDTPLAITGWLDEQNAFVGNLRLTAVGGDVARFSFLPSDLARQEGEEVVGRQNVSLAGDPTLAAGEPKTFQVMVAGVEVPGTYEGQIELLLPGQPRAEAVVVPVTLAARARPALTPLPGTSPLQLELVRCGWALDCGLARLLLPASAFADEWQLQFDNPAQVPVTVRSSEVAALGEHSRYQLTSAQLSLPEGELVLPADQVGSLPLTVRRSALPPDHYTGAIYLALEGQTARETVPLDVSVRTGPWWPLVALFMGLLLGRVFKYMQERGGPQAEALDAVNELEVRLRDAHPDDRTIVAPMLERVRQSVYREKLETVEAALQAIEARLDALGELRRIEGSLAGKEDLPEVQAVLAQVSKAREHLRQQQDAEAATLLAEIKQALLALARAPGMMGEAGEPDEELAASAERAAGAGARIEQAARAPTLAEKVSPADRVKDWLVVLSGLSDQIRAEATLWLVRPLLYFALILGLLAMGISSLYVDKGAAFGANPFGDYLGLVLWGLSADVASRSLSNLQGGGGG